MALRKGPLCLCADFPGAQVQGPALAPVPSVGHLEPGAMAERPLRGVVFAVSWLQSGLCGLGVQGSLCVLRQGWDADSDAEVTRAPEHSRGVGGPQAAVSGFGLPGVPGLCGQRSGQRCAPRGLSWASCLPAQAPSALPLETGRD